MIEQNLTSETLDKWIAKQTAWSLHEAICLLQKIDPDTWNDPIVLARIIHGAP